MCISNNKKENKSENQNIVREFARTHTKEAIETIVQLMTSEDVTASTRLSAAETILTRGWGKADPGEAKQHATYQQLVDFIRDLDGKGETSS